MDNSWLGKLLFIPPVLIGGAVLAWMVVNKAPPAQRPPVEETGYVRIITAKPVSVVPFVLGHGLVSPALSWNAVPQVSGRIVFVHPDFKQGAIVDKGTELVRIAPDDYQLAIRQAEANIRAADARLEELNISASNTAELLKLEGESLTLKGTDFARKQKLTESGTLSQASLDKERRDLLAQRKKVLDLNNAIRLNKVQMQTQKAQIAVNQTQLETARLNLERTHIRMPFKGRISRADVAITQFTAAGQVLGAAYGLKTAEVNTQFPLNQFKQFLRTIEKDSVDNGINVKSLESWIARNQLHARIMSGSGNDDGWDGRLARISNTIDPKSRTVGVVVAADDTYEKAVVGRKPPLIKGMYTEVKLLAGRMEGVLLLPRSIIREGKIYIRNTKGRLEIRSVQTGMMMGSYALITKGLAAGEEVVVSDLVPALPGMLLQGTADTALAAQIEAFAAAGERQ